MDENASMAAETADFVFFMSDSFSAKITVPCQKHHQIIKKISRIFLFFIMKGDAKINFIMIKNIFA